MDLFVFPAGEKSKSRETKAKIEDAMLKKGYRRDCCIIAVGGGVVTDLSGFIAGTYGREMPFIFDYPNHPSSGGRCIGRWKNSN